MVTFGQAPARYQVSWYLVVYSQRTLAYIGAYYHSFTVCLFKITV